VPLAIQDRSFYSDGSLYYPTEGVNPTGSSILADTVLGNSIIVNGEAWPNMKRETRTVPLQDSGRLQRPLLPISLSNGMSFTQIGTDGGFLKAPVQLTSQTIAPAERIDILVDFSNVPAGQKIILENYAGSSSSGYHRRLRVTSCIHS